MSNKERGEAIRRRRLALGINGGRQFAEATGRDRQTLTRAEAGEASATTLDWLEAWLDRAEEENGQTPVDRPPEPIRIEMHGVYGIDQIIVTGPVDRPDEVAETIGKVMDRIRAQAEGPGPE